MAKVLKGFVLDDGTIIGADTLSCLVCSYNDDGTVKNLQIVSPKNINLEPVKGVKVKVGDKGQVELLPDKSGDLREVVVKAWRSVADTGDGRTPLVDANGNFTDLDDEILCRLKFYMTEFELNTYDKVNKSRKNGKLKFKNKDAWQKGVIEAASLDLRAYSTGKGTGGGQALQIASTDADGHENKFKLETDRTVDVEAQAVVPTKTSLEGSSYNGEGGKGIEIMTINSQYNSQYNREYRFKRSAKVYAVTRQPLVVTDDKTDYPTQADDSKDVKDEALSVTWDEIIRGIQYLKQQGLITPTPADQSDLLS